MIRNSYTKRLVIAGLAACLTAPALAQYAYPQNDMSWRIANSRKFWIGTSIPTDCQYPIYAASMTWTNSTVNVRFVWSGYIDGYAYYRDANGNFVESSTNTPDTWVHVAPIDAADNFGFMQPKFNASLYNGALNPPKYASDADHIVNYNRLSEFHCGSGSAPADLRDMESHALHEYGHAWGLGHDLGSTNTTAVMYALGAKGTAGTKRTLLARDIARANYLHGSK